MGFHAYRDPTAAALAAVDALRQENETLRDEIAHLRGRLRSAGASGHPSRWRRPEEPEEAELETARHPRESSALRTGSIVLLAVVAWSVGFAALLTPPLRESELSTTRVSAMELRRAAELWRSLHPGAACPTAEQLRDDRAIDVASRLDDEWDEPFRIACTEDETTVTSRGPDRHMGTPDDVIVPAPPPTSR